MIMMKKKIQRNIKEIKYRAKERNKSTQCKVNSM